MKLEARTLDLVARVMEVIGPELLPAHRDVLVDVLMTGEDLPFSRFYGTDQSWTAASLFEAYFVTTEPGRTEHIARVLHSLELFINNFYQRGVADTTRSLHFSDIESNLTKLQNT